MGNLLNKLVLKSHSMQHRVACLHQPGGHDQDTHGGKKGTNQLNFFRCYQKVFTGVTEGC